MSFVRALKPVPQNRVWRKELIDIQRTWATYLISEDQLSKAQEINRRAIQNAIAIIGSIPKTSKGAKM